MKKLKILLVEDDEHDYFIFKRYLSDIKSVNYSLTWASTSKEGSMLISKNDHDIYIFDYILGVETGIDLIKLCNELKIDAPIILLTGVGNQATDIQAIELGAMDYLVKSDLNSVTLERSLRHAVKHTEALNKIKASENKFRSIFENSYDVIFLSKKDGSLIDINISAERLFRYEKSELLKMRSVDFFESPEDHRKFLDILKENEIVSNYEVTLKDRYGNKKFCLITANINSSEDGETYCQGIICDFTKRKKTEQDLMLAEKFAVTGKVIRTLAHEVRNPLTNIFLATELLQDEIKSDITLPYVDIIKRNSNRINEIIREFLHNSSQNNIRLAHHNIHDILNDTLALTKDRATLKRVEVETQFHPAPCTVTADDEKLKIALANILVNAIEAVEEGKGKINVSTTLTDERISVAIKDN